MRARSIVHFLTQIIVDDNCCSQMSYFVVIKTNKYHHNKVFKPHFPEKIYLLRRL
jgi:hypothetical protein